MFKDLAPLVAKTGVLTLIITGKDGQLTATVLPKPELAKEFAALGSGLSITDTPDALDAAFAQALESFTPQYLDAFEQIRRFKEEADKALEVAREKSKKDVATASKSKYTPPAKKPATTIAPPPLLAGGGGADDDDDDDGEDADAATAAASTGAAVAAAATKDAAPAKVAPPLPPLPEPKDDSALPSLF